MKKQRKHTRRLLQSVLLLGLAAGVILQSTVLAEQCHEIRGSVLRLHILANSDSSRDQLLKLKVRDALLTDGGAYFTQADSKEEAILRTQEHLQALEAIARLTLRAAGCEYPVTCLLETAYFDTRVYDRVTLPAGNYTALRVIIGEGSGQNWWCVMFPPMCIPAAAQVTAQEEPLEEVLTPGQTDLVENGSRYVLKFKVVEWFQEAVNRCREWS